MEPGSTGSQGLPGCKLHFPCHSGRNSQTSPPLGELGCTFNFPGFSSAHLCTQGPWPSTASHLWKGSCDFTLWWVCTPLFAVSLYIYKQNRVRSDLACDLNLSCYNFIGQYDTNVLWIHIKCIIFELKRLDRILRFFSVKLLLYKFYMLYSYFYLFYLYLSLQSSCLSSWMLGYKYEPTCLTKNGRIISHTTLWRSQLLICSYYLAPLI